MARKDVDLVIRAKDEAASVVDRITQALNDFIDAQSNLVGSASKTEGSLGKLGAAIGTLDKAMNKMGDADQFAPQLDKAAASVARLEKGVAAGREEVNTLTRELARSEEVTTRYAAKMDGAAAALVRQKEAVAKAKVEQRSLAEAYEKSVAAQTKMAARQAELPGLIARQSEAVAKTTGRYDELSAAMTRAETPGKSLVNSFEASKRALGQQSEKLNALESEYAGLGAKLQTAQAAVAVFAQQSANAATSLASQERALVKIGSNYSNLSTQTRVAVQQEKALDGALDKATGSLNQQVASLAKASNGYAQIGATAAKFREALTGGASAGKDALGGQIVEQGLAAQRAKKEFDALSASVRSMKQDAAVMAAFRGETKEMAAAIALAAQKADEAQMKFLLQQESLQRLGQAYAGVTDDVRSVANVQGIFAGEQQRLAAAMKETSDEGFRQRQALRALNTEASGADGAVRKLGSASRAAAESAEKNAKATSEAAGAYRRMFGDTRQSLGVTQRLRGEVLSLIAAYGGLYGVINTLGKVTEAYQTIEAAQARLNVANNGDFAKSADDLDFLRRTANRLGVDFGSLATEYSKFAIATQNTNLEGAATRKIFTSVAEAARVSRTSTAELSGVFVALTQIVSKGAVQMEELRQQLGDRLPGALQIMADGLGVTTGQLIKMMEQGEVTADALVPFAEELDRRFGPGLGQALGGTTVALGKLKNATFQALLAFGNAGFIESFTNLLDDLTATIQTADFQAFIANLSVGFAALADALAFVARNFQLVSIALAGFAGLKLAPLVAGLVVDFGKLGAALLGTQAAAGGAYVAMAATGSAAGAAAGGVTLFGRALALIKANPVGLLLTVAAGAMAWWVTEADLATEALTRHKEILDSVKTAYDLTGGSVEEWRKKVEGLTVTEAKSNLKDLGDAAEEAADRLLNAFMNDGETGGQQMVPLLGNFVGASQEYNAAVDRVIRKWRDGKSTAAELLAEIDSVNQEFDDGSAANKRYGDELIAAAKKIVEAAEATAKAELVVKALTGTVEEAGDALDTLGGKADDAGKNVMDTFDKAMQSLSATVDKIKDDAPETRTALEQIADQADLLKQNYEGALLAANQLPDAIMRAAAGQTALNALVEGMKSLFSGLGEATGGRITSDLTEFFKKEEGFRNEAYQDPGGVWTIGMGHTSAAGGLKVTPGLTLTDGEVVKLFEMDIAKFAARVDSAVKVPITKAMRTALISYDYNTGAIVGSEIVRLLNEGQYEAAQKALAGGINTVKGVPNAVLTARRGREAELFGSEGLTNADIAAGEGERDVKREEDRKKAAEEAAKQRKEESDSTKERLADGEFEISQQERINAGKERQAAIEEAVRDAKKDNPNISAAEIAAIEEQTGKLFDLAQQQKEILTDKEKAQKAEEEVNNLIAQRGALMQQMEFAKKDGDTALQEELKTKIEEINLSLVTAIENAKLMWAAVGGSEADAAIAKLSAAGMEAAHFSDVAQKNYLDWSRVADLFVTGLSGAFDKFSQAVAEGQSVGEAARVAFLQFASDFLRQIAQMIIQQAIFNALKSSFGGTSFGAMIGLGHTGGIVGSTRVGSGNMSRSVNPAMFAGAMRYHTGGIVGLAPNEVPIIAKKGEEMLTEADPYHSKNRGKLGGGGAAANVKTRIINAIDPASFLSAALASSEGEKVILNWMTANADVIRSSGG